MFIKPGTTLTVISAPEDLNLVLGDLSEINLSFDSNAAGDTLLFFVRNSEELRHKLDLFNQQIYQATIVWFAYPKKTSGIKTDLKMEKWKELDAYGLSPCGSVAIDTTWSALRIKPVDKVKASGVGNSSIKTSEYAEFIDVENKKVTIPPDLMKLFLQHPHAASFFNSLSYSHQKEYVLWILTAKQEVTRTTRLEKTIQMLLGNKKNPTAK